jgi:hypothetical protein
MKHQASIRQWVTQCETSLHRVAEEFVSLELDKIPDFPLLSTNGDGDIHAMMSSRLPDIGVSSLADIEDAYPCSPMQLGLLISRVKDAACYDVRMTYEVKPMRSTTVDPDLLAAAWGTVVQRHAALRTIFIDCLNGDGLHSQVVLKAARSQAVRLRCESDDDVTDLLNSQPPMSYEDAQPQHRFIICETASGKVFCRLEISHAVIDGFSLSVVFEDLRLAYAGSLGRDSGPLYSEFIAYLLRQPLPTGISYWQSYLAELEPSHFPVLNDGVLTEKRLQTRRIEYEQLSALQNFCDSNGLTLPNAIHAAWALALRCYTGASDVCFGYLSSERDAPIAGIEATVGPMINMLACRVRMPADTQLIGVLEEVPWSASHTNTYLWQRSSTL